MGGCTRTLSVAVSVTDDRRHKCKERGPRLNRGSWQKVFDRVHFVITGALSQRTVDAPRASVRAGDPMSAPLGGGRYPLPSAQSRDLPSPYHLSLKLDARRECKAAATQREGAQTPTYARVLRRALLGTGVANKSPPPRQPPVDA